MFSFLVFSRFELHVSVVAPRLFFVIACLFPVMIDWISILVVEGRDAIILRSAWCVSHASRGGAAATVLHPTCFDGQCWK